MEPRKWHQLLLGRKLDPLDPRTRKHIVLVAFLAWIGLGADGLSSSCYGPEEAFLALGAHPHLALYLAIATAVTVFIIALAYNQVIELFPSGGGGYKAATRLIGPRAGLVSGSALIVDYVLTIAISVASGVDAFFSFLPVEMQQQKLTWEMVLIAALIVLNLRGMKESIAVLLPIFMGFFLSHVALIIYGIGMRTGEFSTLLSGTVQETKELAGSSGWLFVCALFLRSYSLGGGTYTGIEAVSNNINMLAEPRVHTGRWTMFYMAASLAFTAGGIILLYLLWAVEPVSGQTLNAVTFGAIISSLGWGGAHFNQGALIGVMGFEAGLLLVAANTGFLGGPAVMANMAADRWVPRHFRQLSNRLVTQNGVLVMGISSMLILLATHGRVSVLVVLYSINVFLTFSLSLFGMSLHWWRERLSERHWRRRLALSGLGFAVTAFILLVIIVEKFAQGAWATLLITGAVIGLCTIVKRHYEEVAQRLKRVDELYSQRMSWDGDAQLPPADPSAFTAIFFIGNNRGAGMYMLKWVLTMFPERFRNMVFISVGEVDKQAFDAPGAITTLQARIDNSLHYFSSYCASKGYAVECHQAYGADPQQELTNLALRVLDRFPNSLCFASKLVFERETMLTRWLHNEMPLAMQRRLHIDGHQMIIVPIQVPEEPRTATSLSPIR